jgi:hypothetical protein
MIMSSIVHGMIYSVIWKVMRELSIPEAIGLTVIVLAVVAVISSRGSRRRY